MSLALTNYLCDFKFLQNYDLFHRFSSWSFLCFTQLFFFFNIICQGDDANDNSLMAGLNHKNWQVRFRLVAELEKRQDKKAIQALIVLIYDEDPDVAEASSKALVKIGQPAIPELIQSMKNDPFVFKTEPGLSGASKVLAMMNESALNKVVVALKNDDYRIRVNAAKVLGKIGDEKAVKSLCNALSDETWRVRVNARWALQEIGAPAVKSLITLLEIENPQLREAAAMALGNIKDSRSIPILRTTFKKDKNILVRVSAAWALGEFKDKDSIDALITALGEQNGLIRASALCALRKITGQNYTENPENWNRWRENNL
jgi:HEAT repeat protein